MGKCRNTTIGYCVVLGSGRIAGARLPPLEDFLTDCALPKALAELSKTKELCVIGGQEWKAS